MKIESTLDRWHSAVTNRWWMQMFTAFTRCLLAVGFIPPSYKKIMHQPFTTLPDSSAVGHYFNALYQTGFYYEFIGWGQMIAAVLLLIPRTSHIGALIFLPIIVSIAILTSSVGFAGTWLITIFMSLAGIYLVAWEYDRLKPIVFRKREAITSRSAFIFIKVPLFFASGGVLTALAFCGLGLRSFERFPAIAAMLVAMGLVFGLVVTLHYRYMRTGRLDNQLPILEPNV